jgi:predicted negative regulator of RcsB-dependent stress response
MAYDLEEQEQIDEFKAWWKANGKMALGLLVGGLLAYAAWVGYHYSQDKKATEASVLYQTLVTTELTKVADIKTQADAIMANYANTPYAGRAAVYAAKSNAATDVKTAKTELEWAIKNAKETSVRAIAGLQLASILSEEKNYDAAQKVVAGITDKGFEGLKQNMQGDILLALGKTDDAKKAFKIALENLDDQGRMFIYVRQKLESLGA